MSRRRSSLLVRLVLPVGLCSAALSLFLLAQEAPEQAADETQAPTTEAAEDLSAAFRVPEGFRVERFAADDLAHDIFAMTVDPRGNVVVAGPGYLRTLFDDDGDGRADRSVDYAQTKGGAHGLAFDGSNLYATVDDALVHFEDANEDGIADGEPKRILELKSPEHGANGLVWGPDGWLYGVTGNDAGVTARLNTVDKPLVPEPNCGVVWRYDPKTERSEVVAHGFRNPYDLAFLPSGEIVTVDSDGERDQYLPWYAPMRLFDVQLGGHHGWIQEGWQKSWNRPAYYFDVVDRVCEIGRGSPTGVETYDAELFPAKYRGNVFAACWTLGRIYFFDMKRDGSSFVAEAEVFLETKGTVGFAPVDLAVGADGSLFVAVGGRGTQGSVFRLTYEGAREASRDVAEERNLEGRLAVRTRRELEHLLASGERTSEALIRSLKPGEDSRLDLLQYEISRRSMSSDVAFENEMRKRLEQASPAFRPVDVLRSQQILLGDWSVEPKGPAVYAGYELNDEVPESFADSLTEFDLNVDSSPEALAEWLRLAGAIGLSYERSKPAIDLWFLRENLSPQDEIHALICVSRMPGDRPTDATERVASVLAVLPHRMRELGQQPSRNFPDRLREVVTELLARDPALATKLVEHERFGAPAHAEWVGLLPEELRGAATERIVSTTDPEDWTSETVELFIHLAEDRRFAAIDTAWAQPALREATLRRIADAPRDSDVARLMAGLDSPNASTAELCAKALVALDVEPTELQQAHVVRALRQQLVDKQAAEARRALTGLLVRWGAIAEAPNDDSPAAYASVIEAWEHAHPAVAAASSSQSDDGPAWLERLPEIESIAGDAERGKKVFAARSCERCHAGGSKVGPDLKGAAQRFSPKDLLLAIVDPSREVSPTYQTSRLLTKSGKSYVGMVVYESPEGTLLQTDAETTIRIAGEELSSLDKVRQSLMPTGLLREATAAETADLLAYLKTLK